MTAVLNREPLPPNVVQDSPPLVSRQLDSLTSLRGFAAGTVVACHAAGILVQAPIDSNIAFSHSVSFFFVLSGFILSYVHPSVSGRSQILSFWRARVARIYPAHLFSLALILCLCPWSHIASNGYQLLANAFLLHDWIPHYTFFQSYNLPSWSVSDELFFYLLFPILISNLKQNWWMKLASAFGLAMAVIALPCFVKFPTDGLNGLTLFGMYYFFPPSRLFEFVIGMCACVLWTRIRDKKFGPTLATALEIITVSWLFAYGANTYTILKPLLTSPQLFFQGLGTWLTLTGNSFAFAALIPIFATERGWLAKLIKFRPFVWMGDVSYSTYLLHYPIMLQVAQWKQRFGFNAFWAVIVMLAILIPASALSYRFIEMPMRRLIVGKKKPA